VQPNEFKTAAEEAAFHFRAKRPKPQGKRAGISYVQPTLKKIVVNIRSAMITLTTVCTTVSVVALPTPAAPPVTFKPL
jgi:hypothetical protein